MAEDASGEERTEDSLFTKLLDYFPASAQGAGAFLIISLMFFLAALRGANSSDIWLFGVIVMGISVLVGIAAAYRVLKEPRKLSRESEILVILLLDLEKGKIGGVKHGYISGPLRKVLRSVSHKRVVEFLVSLTSD
ncbi:hypothetical protein [Thalassoroseus pseudoceratinae]|uniref:hypothetical protein n=1 Tax=Thalassoroseus pseudoceratinae TaxID=2713176 RepID=UPI00142005EA|nr:hypothetical protein [Thalassoroseus pseudoceratinae]